ncbi:MAG: SCP2 sterol-binding domain-containing protein [Pseudomonadota bacterium]
MNPTPDASPPMTPERFFGVALPQIAARQAGVFRALRGRIVFAIADHGAWTVQLGNSSQPVREGASDAVDLSLFLTAEAFDRLIQNSLDLEQAIERKAVGYEGDLGLLEKLGYLLASGTNADGVQVDQVSIGMKRV